MLRLVDQEHLQARLLLLCGSQPPQGTDDILPDIEQGNCSIPTRNVLLPLEGKIRFDTDRKAPLPQSVTGGLRQSGIPGGKQDLR